MSHHAKPARAPERTASRRYIVRGILSAVLAAWLLLGAAWPLQEIRAEETTGTGQTEAAESSSTSAEPSGSSAEPSVSEPTAAPEPPAQAFLFVGEQAIVPAETGETIRLILPLINWGTADAEDVTVTPMLSEEDLEWPFEIEQTDYTVRLDGKLTQTRIPGDRERNTVKVDLGQFTVRAGLSTGYYRLPFTISYRVAGGQTETAERQIYLKLVNPDDDNDIDDIPEPVDPGWSDSGWSDPGWSDPGNGTTQISAARLICTGFTTTPGRVEGGDSFKLTLKLKNTSKETKVKNIRLVLENRGEDSTFLPVTGASTIFIEEIAANSETAVSIDLKSSPTLAQKAYPLGLMMEYEDKNGSPLTADETISIQVYQDPRIDFSKEQCMPDLIEVGGEANVMFSIYNKGKTMLYNVSVIIPEDGALEGNEIFLGNVEAGSSRDADFNVIATQGGLESVDLMVRYEDEEGNVSEMDKPIALSIVDEIEDSMPEMPGESWPDESWPDETGSTGFLGLGTGTWLLIGAGLVGLVILIAVLVRRRRNKKEMAELDEIP